MVRCWLIAGVLALSVPASALAAGADPVAAAVALKRQHHFQAAERALAGVLERDPEDLGANLQMGYLKNYLGDSKGALPFIKRAAAAHPEDLEAQTMLVHAYLWVDRIDEADRQADKTVAAWEGKKTDRSLWAKLLVGVGGIQGLRAQRDGLWAMIKYGMAVRGTFEEAYALDPDGTTPLFALGSYYLEAPGMAGGDPSKGLDLLHKAIRREPESYVGRAKYAFALYQQGHKAEAREELDAYRRDFADIPVALSAIQPLADKLQ